MYRKCTETLSFKSILATAASALQISFSKQSGLRFNLYCAVRRSDYPLPDVRVLFTLWISGLIECYYEQSSR